MAEAPKPDHVSHGWQRIRPRDVPAGRLVSWQVDGHRLVLGRVGTGLYAYREICPGCGSSLMEAQVSEGAATCPVCEHRFQVREPGHRLDDAGPGLEPVPLTQESEGIHVAIGGAP